MKPRYERPIIVRHAIGGTNKFGAMPAIRPVTSFEGVALEELVAAYGSPLFLFSERMLRDRIRELRDQMSRRFADFTLAWSYKTNYLGAICRVFHQEGAWAEVVSGMEMRKALRAGVPGTQIVFNGPHKSRADLELAFRERARVHLDHLDELALAEQVAEELGVVPEVGIRVNISEVPVPAWDRFGLIDDDLASRMHAVIEVASEDDITLIDLGNEPGTMVNGARVNKCKVHPGDQIQIGDTLVVLENAEPAVAGVEAAAVPAMAAVAAPAAAPLPPPAAPAANPFAGAPDPFAPKPAANPFGGGGGANPFGGGADPFAFAAPNPFAAAADPFAPAEQPAGEGGYKYVMTKSGPDVNPDEVEVANVPAIEVMILWGDAVLHVVHLSPPRSFYVGEEEGKNLACDYFIPQEKLGTTRAPVVLAQPGAGVSMVLLPRAKGMIELPGQPKMKIEEAIQQGRVQACAELSGAHQIALPPGSKVRMEMDNLVFQVATVNAGRKAPAGLFASRDWSTALYVGLSMVVHTGLLAAMAFFMPPLGLTDDEGVNKDQLFLMQQYLNAAAEREMEQKETEQVAEDNADNKEGGTGTRAKGEEGSMGNPNSRDANKRYGVAGPKDNQDAHIARSAALREAAEFGMIGLLNTGAGGDPNAPTAPWGRDDYSRRIVELVSGRRGSVARRHATGSRCCAQCRESRNQRDERSRRADRRRQAGLTKVAGGFRSVLPGHRAAP